MAEMQQKLQLLTLTYRQTMLQKCGYNWTVELLSRATLTQLKCLAARKMEFPDFDSTNYVANVQTLRYEFTSRFPEFRQDEIKVKSFAHLFDLAVEDSSGDCQMELIQLQAGEILRIAWWTSTNSMIVECYSICPVMQE